VNDKLSPDEAYARVKALDAQRRLVWPHHPRSTTRMPGAKGISSNSDLAKNVRAGDEVRLASTVVFVTRADGLKPREQTYGFQFGEGNLVAMEAGSIYSALRRSGEFDVGVAPRPMDGFRPSS